MIEQEYRLNLVPGSGEMPPVVHVSQYDVGSRTLRFRLHNNGVLFAMPSNAEITCDGIKPDKKGFSYEAFADGNDVLVNIEKQMAVVSGPVICQITIKSGLQTIGTANFTLAVETGPLNDDTDVSETELPIIMQNANEAAEKAQAAQTAAEMAQSKAETAQSKAESAKDAAHTSETRAASSAANAAIYATNAESSELAAANILEQTKEVAVKAPYVGDNGNWYAWDNVTKAYKDTGVNAKGDKGDKGDNATVNGVETLEIVAGAGIEGSQSGNTFTITATVGGNNSGAAHNAIYRGKDLGSSVTDEQYAAIKDGRFYDMYIGDYWFIGGVIYRIAGFDYYLRSGDTGAFTNHHIVIVPDTPLYTAKMNNTATTDGGYVGSAMYQTNLEQAKTTINAVFNGHILKHRTLLVNAVTDGHPSAAAWCDSEVELMTEQMVYGGAIYMPISDGSSVFKNSRLEKSQLPLFAHSPRLIANNQSYWLRDVVSSSQFSFVYQYGTADVMNANAARGVRPAFCIV